ncbi:cilia- and flagella-associated protein 70-like isoform X3 [Photinus pyralis]|uniref:cilia- and flagella-associated protein 70-like isoform X3 n=1 Tax=Photinus pyralis TaxID=7054 RepID=UPI0012670009|nr:cilia- and flagella-associated protein 70-like isoform X3 [Photinus pyralis]
MSDIKHVRITLCGYKGIVPTYSIADVNVQAHFLGTDLGTSTKAALTDDEYCATSFDFVIPCDVNSAKSLDDLISNPLQFKVYEHPGRGDKKIMDQLPARLSQDALATSSETTINLIEVFAKRTFDRSAFVTPECYQSPRGSKSEKSETPFPAGPILLGSAQLDFLPLFQGREIFTQSLLIHKSEQPYDDDMVPVNLMPCLMVEVNIEGDGWLPRKYTNILSVTIESIYNLPNVMSADMDYSVSVNIPNAHSEQEHVVIHGGTWKTGTNMCNMKLWPKGHDPEVNRETCYRMADTVDTIHNKINANLEKVANPGSDPRVEFNVIKRNYLMEQASRLFRKNLKDYRHLPLEVFISRPGMPKDAANSLHLMANVDLSTLLYPGVSRCRASCGLRTFHKKEILQRTGLQSSYFAPDVNVGKCATPVVDKKGGKAKDDKSKASKSDKGASSKVQDLKQLLPSPVVVEEPPSVLVYGNQQGERTFIVVEIELQKPLEMQRPIEDLTVDLINLLPPRPMLSKHVISARLAVKQYRDGIKQLTEDILSQHDKFLVDMAACPCVQFGIRDTKNAFLTFLQKNGIYQTYLSSFTKIACVAIKEKFPYVEETNPNNKDYQNYIGEVFSSLTKESHDMINLLSKSGVEPKATTIMPKEEDLFLLYGEEACEIGAILLADRYFLERVCQAKKKATSWFDYAVFYLKTGDEEKAFECVRRSLLENEKFKYSLLMFALLLCGRNKKEEAETCFLTAMFFHPTWLEGWVTMHLFYSHIGNSEGADLCLEMAHKYMNTPKSNDYFTNRDNLIWTTSICPNELFFRTAALLIKMYFFEKNL